VRKVGFYSRAWCWVAVGVLGVASAEPIRIASVSYQIPALYMVRQTGESVLLPEELNDGRPVVLNFIFTSCGAICPLMTQTMASFQHLLGPDSAGVHIVSISIDPEEDTPARLRDYAREYHAGAGWTFYTGTPEASIAAQKAFNMYRGDKMSHTAVTFMRAASGERWERLDGFATPEQLLGTYRRMINGRVGVGEPAAAMNRPEAVPAHR
jgi:protein SCO1/2